MDDNEKMTTEDREAYERMMRNEEWQAMPYKQLKELQRKFNQETDLGKIKAREKRRKANKVAKASRKVNRQKKKK